VRLRKVEVVFLGVAAVTVVGIFLVANNPPREFGPKRTGQIRMCWGPTKGGPSRQCLVTLRDRSSIMVDVPLGRGSAGDSVTFVEMRRGVSSSAYYVVPPRRDP
jgi:hypothetical protein